MLFTCVTHVNVLPEIFRRPSRDGSALVDDPGCAVIISHDRFFLDRIATHILSFEGDAHVEWFEGKFADYIEDRKRRLGGGTDPAPDEA